MPHIHIPPEVLLKILAHVRDNGSPDFHLDYGSLDFHLDLLSCSMVSRFWFDCAWPFVAEFFNQNRPLDLDAYSTAKLAYVVDTITKLCQLGVWETTLLTSVMTVIDNYFFVQTSHGSRADINMRLMRLMHVLQPPSKSLEIHIPYNFTSKQATIIRTFVSQLYPGTTSLCITRGRYNLMNPGFRGLPGILVHDLRNQLQSITISCEYSPAFILALSDCPNIRNVNISIKPTSNPRDLSAAVLNWPELRSLKIFGDSSDIDPVVEQLAMNPPKHLESLHFDRCETPLLRNLIISLAPRLVHLAFPHKPLVVFLDLITSLDMPCLRYLDFSNLNSLIKVENVVQRYWVEGQSNPISLLRWPKLQRINFRYTKLPPLFLKLLMASCPALEDLRFFQHNIITVDLLNQDEWNERKRNEAILEDAGWTQSETIVFDRHTPLVTFTRPGGNVWEVEELVERKKSRTLDAKIGGWNNLGIEKNVDAVVFVHIEHVN